MHILYIFLMGTFLLSITFQSTFLISVNGVISLIILFNSIRYASNYFRLFAITFLIFGTGVMLHDGNTHMFLSSTTNMVPILILLSLLPFISSFFLVGKFEKTLKTLVTYKVTNMQSYYRRIILSTFLMAFFLSFAAIPLLVGIVQNNLAEADKDTLKTFITKSILPGFTLGQLCSPMELLIVLTIELTGVKYITLLPYLLIVAIIMIFVVINGSYSKEIKSIDIQSDNQSMSFKNLLILIVFLVGFLSTLIIIEITTEMRFIIAVILLIIPYTFLWSVAIQRLRIFKKHSVLLWISNTKTLYNFATLFIPLGFFVSQFQESSFFYYFQDYISILTEGSRVFYLLLPIGFLILTIIGFHPLLIIGIIAGGIGPILDVLNPIGIAIILISSAMCTMVVGPFNVTVLMIKNLINNSIYGIIKRNIVFALLLGLIGTSISVIIF